MELSVFRQISLLDFGTISKREKDRGKGRKGGKRKKRKGTEEENILK